MDHLYFSAHYVVMQSKDVGSGSTYQRYDLSMGTLLGIERVPDPYGCQSAISIQKVTFDNFFEPYLDALCVILVFPMRQFLHLHVAFM